MHFLSERYEYQCYEVVAFCGVWAAVGFANRRDRDSGPGEGDALVQVEGAAINPSDIGIVVVTKGNHPEDAEVWGSSAMLGSVRGGSHAEYVVPAETLSLKPRLLSKVFSFDGREDQQGR